MAGCNKADRISHQDNPTMSSSPMDQVSYTHMQIFLAAHTGHFMRPVFKAPKCRATACANGDLSPGLQASVTWTAYSAMGSAGCPNSGSSNLSKHSFTYSM